LGEDAFDLSDNAYLRVSNGEHALLPLPLVHDFAIGYFHPRSENGKKMRGPIPLRAKVKRVGRQCHREILPCRD